MKEERGASCRKYVGVFAAHIRLVFSSMSQVVSFFISFPSRVSLIYRVFSCGTVVSTRIVEGYIKLHAENLSNHCARGRIWSIFAAE